MADTAEVQPHEAEQTPQQQPERKPGGEPGSNAPQQNAPPQQQQPKREEKKPKKSWGRRIREHPIGFLAFLILLIGVAIGAYFLMQYFSSYEDTDDAEIDGNIYAITSRIAGTVTAVHVEDNQRVKKGEVLVELDPRDYNVSIEQARASLEESRTLIRAARPNVPITSVTTETTVATAEADVASARAAQAAAQRDYESLLAQVRQSEADNVKAQADLVRYRQLVAKDEISQQQFDQADAAAKAAAATVDARKAAAEAAARAIDEANARLQQTQTRQVEARRNRPSQIAIQNAQVASREATAQKDQAMLDQALLNLSYTKIVAPIDGVIGKKNAEPGQQISAGQQLMAVVPLGDIWVTANFKETQLREMRPGQPVTIHVDAFNRDYDGYVENLAGASGARFSLLPPENATGNYVKVVQRVPLRIGFKQGQDPNFRLRPGMSVEPKVWLNKGTESPNSNQGTQPAQ
jgi:membrane fusion protein (multidrug efflux system)